MIRLGLAALALVASTAAGAREPAGLHQALDQLSREGRFSGAVVIRRVEGVRFARGYGMADPFTGRRFTPDTPVDSGSLAKPVTAAAVLMLARDGKLDLDAPVTRYLPEFPHRSTTARHLLAHSAGLVGAESEDAIVGKTNAQLLSDVAKRDPAFPPGTGFVYCNFCYTTLALLIEQASGKPYLQFVRDRVALPSGVTIRPARLADWRGRAIGHRRASGGKVERADSYENELFYGSANFSISAEQLARWGAERWKPQLDSIRDVATTPATIGGNTSGLSLGNWYCAPTRSRCHYLGHHEGFHHMLYWDADRRISVAMVSNNSLAPALQQRLQRAIVAFAENTGAEARRELSLPLLDTPVLPGKYKLPTGETVKVITKGNRMAVNRRGIDYLAFPIGSGIRYVPGLDLYVAGAQDGRLQWLSLYEDFVGAPAT